MSNLIQSPIAESSEGQPSVAIVERGGGDLEQMQLVEVGGIPFVSTSLAEAVERTIRKDSRPLREGLPVRLSNAYCVALASRDSDYARLLRGQGVNYPDGTPVVWFMRRVGPSSRSAGRVRGPSFFESVIDKGRDENLRHFFFGSTPETLEILTARLLTKFPGTKIVGSHSPTFSNDPQFLADQLPDYVSAKTVDIVWVGLGTPKQDYVGALIAERVPVVVPAVGAAFDFTAGTSREAPKWVQDSGMEWMFRLLSEPRRLWKRYVFGNARFLYVAVRQRDRSKMTMPHGER